MARRTKIPIVILLGILFLFVAISLYRGCSVVEGNALLYKYIKTLDDLKKCRTKPAHQSGGGGAAAAAALHPPSCPTAESWETNCEVLITNINKKISEGFEVSHGLKTAEASYVRGNKFKKKANEFWGKPLAVLPWINTFHQLLGGVYSKLSKYNYAKGKQLKIDGESTIRDLSDVLINMEAKNTKIHREIAERDKTTELAKTLSDILSTSTKGAAAATNVSINQEQDIRDLDEILKI